MPNITPFSFKINNVEIAHLIAYKGLKWTRNDIDSANAGRTLSGKMNRGRVCTKVKLEIKCIPLTQPQLNNILNLIDPEYVFVTYTDPKLGYRHNIEFYSNNVPATFATQATDGSLLWEDVSFPLVER